MDTRKWLHGGAAASARPPSALPTTEEGTSAPRTAISEEQEPAANVSRDSSNHGNNAAAASRSASCWRQTIDDLGTEQPNQVVLQVVLPSQHFQWKETLICPRCGNSAVMRNLIKCGTFPQLPVHRDPHCPNGDARQIVKWTRMSLWELQDREMMTPKMSSRDCTTAL